MFSDAHVLIRSFFMFSSFHQLNFHNKISVALENLQ
jgi:hypothetical protein